MKFQAGRPAFTLFEMVLVLAVLVVVAAAIYPSIDSMYGDYKVTGAADMVRGIWAEGQARAMDEGRPYRFALIPNANNFRIAPDSADFWSGGDTNSVTTNSAEPPFVREGVLPKGVRFTDAQAQAADPSLATGSAVPPGSQDSSGWLTVATFLPDGTAREDAEVRLTAPRARPLILKLRGLTGVVTLKPLSPEGQHP